MGRPINETQATLELLFKSLIGLGLALWSIQRLLSYLATPGAMTCAVVTAIAALVGLHKYHQWRSKLAQEMLLTQHTSFFAEVERAWERSHPHEVEGRLRQRHHAAEQQRREQQQQHQQREAQRAAAAQLAAAQAAQAVQAQVAQQAQHAQLQQQGLGGQMPMRVAQQPAQQAPHHRPLVAPQVPQQGSQQRQVVAQQTPQMQPLAQQGGSQHHAMAQHRAPQQAASQPHHVVQQRQHVVTHQQVAIPAVAALPAVEPSKRKKGKKKQGDLVVVEDDVEAEMVDSIEDFLQHSRLRDTLKKTTQDVRQSHQKKEDRQQNFEERRKQEMEEEEQRRKDGEIDAKRAARAAKKDAAAAAQALLDGGALQAASGTPALCLPPPPVPSADAQADKGNPGAGKKREGDGKRKKKENDGPPPGHGVNYYKPLGAASATEVGCAAGSSSTSRRGPSSAAAPRSGGAEVQAGSGRPAASSDINSRGGSNPQEPRSTSWGAGGGSTNAYWWSVGGWNWGGGCGGGAGADGGRKWAGQGTATWHEGGDAAGSHIATSDDWGDGQCAYDAGEAETQSLRGRGGGRNGRDGNSLRKRAGDGAAGGEGEGTGVWDNPAGGGGRERMWVPKAQPRIAVVDSVNCDAQPHGDTANRVSSLVSEDHAALDMREW